MSNPATYLVQLTPPRHSALAPRDQVEMVAALAPVRRAVARGVALEIVGDAGHVRFLARAASAATLNHVGMVFSGYYPQGMAAPLDDPADDPAVLHTGEGALAVELRLRSRNELPLHTLDHDETGAQLLRVIGVLRTLPAGTRGVCQLILWPAPSRWGHDVERWLQQERMRRSLEIRQAATAGTGLPAGVVAGLIFTLLVGAVGYRYYHAHDLAHLAGLGLAVSGVIGVAAARRILVAPDPPPDLELVERKLATPSCAARLRLLVAGGDDAGRRRALDALIAAYGAYEEPRGNAFVARPCAPGHLAAITTTGAPRLWRRPWPVLSAAEVASLFHLPADDVDVPGLARTGPRTLLPAPGALKEGAPIGTVTLGAHREAVHIPHAAYRSNVLVLGATGTGKSTFLQHYTRAAVAREDAQLVVIDPDSALVADMVGWLPDHQKLRAVVVEFGRPDYAIGLNLLDAYTSRRTDQIVDSLVQAWARYYGEAWGPRLEDLVRYACATILAANGARPRERQLTLLDVKPLLQIPAFRDAVVRQADDLKLTAYWRDDYLGMPRSERLNAIKPVLTRVNRFLLNDAAHAVVGQPASTLDIPHLLATGAPLFIDTAAHAVGEETAALLDAVLLNTIHDAVCERRDRRRQVLIVADEFQHAPALWDEYLPRIRKFGGAYVLAAQGIASIDRVQRDLHTVVIGNTATHIVFRTPDPDEARYLAGVLDNAVAAEDVQTLGLRCCYVKTSDERGPLPVVSVAVPPPPTSNGGTARLITAACARRYGRPVADVLAAHTRWMTALFHTPQTERTTTVAGASETERRDDAPVADETARPPRAATDAPGTTSHPAMGTGSQPVVGLPPTRASPWDSAPSRRSRRHKRLAAPNTPASGTASSSGASSAADPLPLPLAEEPAPRQLPLLPGIDAP